MPSVTVSSARYFVSEEMFAIITEAICRRSNNTQKFQSLRSVIQHAVDELQSHVFINDHFQDFVKSVPLSGRAKIYLRVEATINERLGELKAKLADVCGTQVYDRTAIAYFLQLYIEKRLY
jgi:hypothetical protein